MAITSGAPGALAPEQEARLREWAARAGLSAEELLARSVAELVSDGATELDEFDVEAFLQARRSWQYQGRTLCAGLVEPEDAHR
jgi:hypothetical protein